MSIVSAVYIASSGLRNVTKALAVVSQNVANSNTASYAVESTAGSDLTAGGVGFGVAAGVATRDVDSALEASVFAQNGDVAAKQTTSDALAQIDATQGTTAAGNDLASQVGALTDAFTTLSAEPSNAAQQNAVVLAAGTLAANINATADAYQAGRQAAQDSIVTEVGQLNSTLTQIGALNNQIVEAKALGQSTADFENQRDAAESQVAQLAGITFLPHTDGSVVAFAGGNEINLQSPTGLFSIANATLAAADTGPGLLLGGKDVSTSVTSGQIGANLTLRDTTLPAGQAALDEFAQTLATRLGNQGLQLFTTPAGTIPAGGGTPVQSTYLGFANVIQVNPAVTANNALVRDGTNSVAAGTGGAAAFTPNPSTGPAGFTTLIDNVVTFGFGADAQAGTAQPAPATTGLGLNGNVTLSYGTSPTIAGFAANLVGAQSSVISTAATALTDSTSLQTTLQQKLSAGSGVSVDAELSNLIILQNAYGANAKVLTAAQSLWTDLYNAVTGAQ